MHPALTFGLTAAMVAAAGVVLTRAADRIAERTGWGRFLVGSVFVAIATSLPELSVDLSAVRLGEVDLAVGDLMGSGLVNLLVLAAVDLASRTRRRLLSHASAAHALSATASITLTALAGAFILARVPAQLLGLGIGSVAIAVTYGLTLRLVYYDQLAGRRRAFEAQRAPSFGWRALGPPASAYLGAATVILLVAPLVARSAAALAERSGLGTTFVGTTLVATATSLPEIVTAITALRAGAVDLAAGNVFGSNAFNMVILVVLDAASPGSLLATVAPVHALTALCVVVITAVVVMGQLYTVERRYWLIEPDALVVAALVAAAFALVYLGGR